MGAAPVMASSVVKQYAATKTTQDIYILTYNQNCQTNYTHPNNEHETSLFILFLTKHKSLLLKCRNDLQVSIPRSLNVFRNPSPNVSLPVFNMVQDKSWINVKGKT